jgi:hypothetical protein
VEVLLGANSSYDHDLKFDLTYRALGRLLHGTYSAKNMEKASLLVQGHNRLSQKVDVGDTMQTEYEETRVADK